MLKLLFIFAVLLTISLESNRASGLERFSFDIENRHDSSEDGESFVDSSGTERILKNDARTGMILTFLNDIGILQIFKSF